MVSIAVSKPYRASNSDPIRFEAGEVVLVQQESSEFPGWFWCADPRGKVGWVHHSVLTSTHDRANGLTSYDATELTVIGGEIGIRLQRLGGWLRVRLDDAREGWLPESHVVAQPTVQADGPASGGPAA